MKRFTIPSYLILLFLLVLVDLTVLAQQASIWDRVPEDIKNQNWFKRYEWLMRPRIYPYDTLPIYTFRSQLKIEMEKEKLNKGNNLNSLQWNNIGPSGIIFGALAPHWGEVSGRIRGIAVHPTDPSIVYIATAAGGIWKTTDGGQNWNDIASDLPSLSYGAITIDPNNPDIIYAGGGEIQYGIGDPWIYDGDGVYKSTDAGLSWTQYTDSLGSVTHFGDIEVSPHNSNLVFAALGSGNLFTGNFTGNLPNEGIWKSTDGGEHWTKKLDVVDGFDIIVHPTDPNIVYASTGGQVTTSGFYISTDAGDTWVQSDTGLQATNTIARMQIEISKSDPSTIYGVIYQSGSGPYNGITRAYKSTNGGNSWNQISAGTPLGGYSGTGWYDQGWYDLCIAVNPSDDQQVFIGNVELHQTLNGSQFSVKRIPGGTNAWGCPTHTDIHKIVFAQSNNNIVYIGCDGGIYKSTDAGDNWSSINNGISTIQLYRLASHPNNHDTLIGGAQDNTNFVTVDGGATPWHSFSGGDGMECFFDYSEAKTIYFSTQHGQVYKSMDLGNSVMNLGYYNGFWIAPFIIHPLNNNYLYLATTKIYRSTDGGATIPFPIIADSVVDDPNQPIISMAQSKVEPDNMIICGSYSILYVKVSSDGGFTWTDVSGNIPGDPAVYIRVTCHPTEPNTMYLVKTGFSAGNKLYMTTDLGTTWTNVSGDLPNVPQSDFFIDPDSTNHYYIANDLGVYSSTNAGVNWVREGDGMPFVPVLDFDYVDYGNGQRFLRAGTHGRSIYEAILPTVITNVQEKNITEVPIEFVLAQNYPNPFNPITNISYTLPAESQVKLSVYNPLGELVETIVSEKQRAGMHDAVWNAGRHPSGVYIYTLDAVSLNGNEQKKLSKKMILLK